MIIEINKLQREILGTIKTARYKSVKCLDATPTAVLFTKVLHFPREEPIEWLEKQLFSRGNTLKQIEGTSLTIIREKRLLQAYIKKNQQGKTFYLTTKFMLGWNLADILLQRQQNSFLNDSEKIKSIIFEIIGLLIAGKGFSNLIVTNQVLFLRKVNQSTYKPILNYLSFAGLRFLHQGKEIDKQQYLQLAMFLDEEAYETGNIDRFQFKVRNLACIILTILCRRNPHDFIFQQCQLQAVISKDKAKFLHKEVVQPKIKQLLGFKSLKKSIEQLKIKGLHQFLENALVSFSSFSQRKDWSHLQSIFFGENWNSSSIFGQIARLFWDSQSEIQKQQLRKKGLVCLQSSQVYLAMKLSASFQFMLQNNDWQSMIENSEYTRMNRQMFFQALKYFIELQEQTVKQHLPLIKELSKLLLKNKIEIQDRSITLLTYEQEIMLSYPKH